MKKIFTLLSAVVMGLASLQAAPAKADLKPAGLSDEFKAMSSQIAFDKSSFVNDKTVTRYWVDNNDNYWTAQFLFPDMEASKAFKFFDKDGNEIPGPSMKDDPYWGLYIVYVILSREGAVNSQQQQINDNVTTQYAIFWPSHFLWNQIYDESVFEGEDPIMSKVDITPVPFETLTNTSEFCRAFVEVDPTSENFNFWTVENGQIISYALLNLGGYTQNYTTGKSQELNSAFAEGVLAQVEFLSSDEDQVSFEAVAAGVGKTTNEIINLPIQYEGTSRVDGFSQKNITWPDLGGIHVFDCGVVSSKTNGSIWSGEFPELQKYIVWGFDKYIDFEVSDVDDEGKPYTNSTFRPTLGRVNDFPATENFADHLNYFRFVVYSAKGEGPQKNIWTMTYAEDRYDEAFGQDYVWYAPTANCIISYNYTGELNQDFVPRGLRQEGVMMMYHDYPYTPSSHTQLGIGTDNGFQIYAWDDYNNYIDINYTGEITFHNNPNKPSDVTTFNSIGDLILDGVEEVENVENVAPVYYNLQGVRVNNPENGLYIVVRGNETQKVFVRK